MEELQKLRMEIEEIRQLSRLQRKRLDDMERIVDSLKVRLALIDSIPKMQFEIDTVKAKIRTLTEGGHFG